MLQTHHRRTPVPWRHNNPANWNWFFQMSWSVTLSAPKAETGRQNKKSHMHVRNKRRWYFIMINLYGLDFT